MQSEPLRWGTVQFCLFRRNNADFCVKMGNGLVCWDGKRFSLAVGMVRYNNAEFSVGMGNGSVMSVSM